ncbi:MAG TPA: M20/M25/M40 family metallo-hydrolase, partial [Chloroflexota bacterium]|nr:M20/M25/M40 family metallo-hydrolase [Chloroflexota bacterium]
MIDVEQLIDDTLTICAIPAPTGQEQARARYLYEQLRGLQGLDVWTDAVGNLVARVRGAPPATHDAAAATLVAAHLDTVFGDGVEPRPTRVGQVLRGPGIGDNALAVATLLTVARTLAGQRLDHDLILAGTVGEEGLGNLRGIRALLDAHAAAQVLALEGHGVDALVRQAVGSVRLAVTFSGPGGHSWRDRGAPSAVHALARAAARVAEEVPATFPGCAANVGVFHGGSGVNVIAAHAELQLDLRALEPDTLQAGEAL